MELSGQFHARAALPQGKLFTVSTGQEAECLGIVEKTKIF
jgi:hypothetical protein